MSEGMLAGLTVLVSGVGPGLGREITTAALREGAQVMMAARTEARLKQIGEEVDPSGERLAWHVTDIAEAAQCEDLVAAAVARFGHLDAVVHCAAVDNVMGGLRQADFADLDRVLGVNLYGTLYLTRAALEPLAASGRGSIVVIGAQSSISGAVPQLFYSASKGALTSAMRHLAAEVGPQLIRVNSVVPGWMYGPPVEGYVRMEAERRQVSADAVLAELTASMPLGRMATDGDVAETAVFFASPRSKGITGQTLLVNAGEIMH
jgi:NAD(P)-dependent dehydrogenase (short-subunit alcohol dehydrogenase family)